MNLIDERTIALAGIFQACGQVQSLARTGEYNEAVFDSSIKSILVLDAVNTTAVYGGLDGIRTGLKLIAEGVLRSADADDVELLRYVMSLLHLQNQLYKNNETFNQFGNSVERLSAVESDNLIYACSDLYKSYISVMRPQIIVQGEQGYLQRDDIPSKIRALLLAGFRSAVLWHQKSGGKFKLIWQRTRMQNVAKELLATIVSH